MDSAFSRRTAMGLGLAALAGTVAMRDSQADEQPDVRKVVEKGRIRQSVVSWCFTPYWDVPRMAQIARGLGCQSIELCPTKFWPALKELDMTPAIASSHGFVKGLNDPAHWDECLTLLRQRIDECAQFGVPSVITFTGMRGRISDEDGIRNCVAAYKQIVGLAEEKKVTLCLEHLNSRDSSHPMKGHPGYQGDRLEHCLEIIRQVGSPRLKLLFDIYHVQIMHGDVIRRLRECHEQIGHVHTAGNPGRGELDDNQEINYPPIMRALVEVGYKGYVGQEFIPTRDALEGLTQAVRLCDV